MTLKSLTHKMTAYFQAVLSITFIVEYFLVLRLFLDGHVKVPGEYHDMMIALLGVLTGSVMTIVTFWFNRQRTSTANPDDPQPIPQAIVDAFARAIHVAQTAPPIQQATPQ